MTAEELLKKIPTISVPGKLPISGRKGAKKLERLLRRANYLYARLTYNPMAPKILTWDMSELSALRWAIEAILMYEGLLKRGPTEETEEKEKEEEKEKDTN